MNRKLWYAVCLGLMLLLAACGAGQSIPGQPILGDSLRAETRPSSTAGLTIPRQTLPPTPIPGPSHGTTPTTGPSSVSGPMPYGPPPAMTSAEMQYTQQLFALINHDRAVRGLYPFAWNATLAAGARLHSWNMYYCGFSHTCPDGLPQCTRIANEGFTFTDCGENIGMAGPTNTLWNYIYQVQESMMNEGPTGWHFIHLTSTTLHRIGVGIYVDSSNRAWFTEDMIS